MSELDSLMLFSDVAPERLEPPQATAREMPKPPLHNFVLPSLKWGNQRQLRCMKVDSERTIVSSSFSSSLDRRSNGDGDPTLGSTLRNAICVTHGDGRAVGGRWICLGIC